MPCSMALAAASPAATCAANGVDFLEPRKPRAPALDQQITFPAMSVTVTIVLLNVALMWTMPCWTFFLTFFLTFLSSAIPQTLPKRGDRRRAPREARASLPSLPQLADGPPGALAGTGVGVRPLSAHRQPLAVTQSAIAAEVHQPLDVHRDLAAEIALDLVVAFDHLADAPHLVLGEVLGADRLVDPGLLADLSGREVADAVDVLKGDDDPLFTRKIHAGDTCHLLLRCSGFGAQPWRCL